MNDHCEMQTAEQLVGITPKRYARVRRFQAVISMVTSGAPVSWPAVAAGCGHFDQAHFIRDFKRFSGLTPGKYAILRGDQRNHVPLGE